MKSLALQAAIDFEKKGYAYYSEIAGQAESPLTRRLFYSLAEEELQHIKRIEEIFASLDGVAAETEGSHLEDDVRNFFEGFSRQQRQDWEMDNADAYLRAMELERQGYAMYVKFADEAADPREADFFKALQGEEESHLEALENVYGYFANPGDWSHEDERNTWSWMNL